MDGDQMDASIFLPRKDQEFHVTVPLHPTTTDAPPLPLVRKSIRAVLLGRRAHLNAEQLQNHACAEENG